MEDSKTLFCSSKFPMACKRTAAKFTDNLGTHPHKVLPALGKTVVKVWKRRLLKLWVLWSSQRCSREFRKPCRWLFRNISKGSRSIQGSWTLHDGRCFETSRTMYTQRRNITPPKTGIIDDENHQWLILLIIKYSAISTPDEYTMRGTTRACEDVSCFGLQKLRVPWGQWGCIKTGG